MRETRALSRQDQGKVTRFGMQFVPSLNLIP